MLQKHQVVKY